ncbi:unnamed protein product, partial [Pylaiella littoralis]
ARTTTADSTPTTETELSATRFMWEGRSRPFRTRPQRGTLPRTQSSTPCVKMGTRIPADAIKERVSTRAFQTIAHTPVTSGLAAMLCCGADAKVADRKR